MKILFPCSPLDDNKVDKDYLEEHHAAKLQGNECFLFDHDKFILGDFKSNLPKIDDNSPLMLRGWMVSISKYEELYILLIKLGYTLINTPEQYKNCHYFPYSYDYTKDYTSKSMFIKNWDESILQDISNFFGKSDFIMKDFVKSAKHISELFIIPSGIKGVELLERAEKFIKVRGDSFNEGLVFKEFADLKRDSDDKLNEWRLFYYEGKLASSSPNSNQSRTDFNHPEDFIESVVNGIAFQIDSNFFTIDIAEKEDGSWIIIENGDGQVSGLSPNQNFLEFYASLEGKN